MRFSELDGKAVAVWGLGREIRSLAEHVRSRLPATRIAVIVREDLADDGTDAISADAIVVGADGAVDAVAGCDVLIRSPGVSIYRPELRALTAMGLPVTTATALWIAERDGRKLIGVTGTKGKSTTATLIHHLLTAAGYRAQLAGNIGRPALDLLDLPASEWAVVELSSYQVADMVTGTAIAVVTNLYKEHTDWHLTESNYRRDKSRLTSLPGVEACVLPSEWEGRCAGATTLRFGVPDGWHVAPDGIRNPDGVHLPREALPLPGRHNALNLCAALAAIDAAGLRRPELPEGIAAVQALPHRLQTVGHGGGFEWVDDSISTTPESAIAALDAFEGRPVVLVAGGQERDQDYRELGRLVAQRGVIVLGLPTTGSRLVAAARDAGSREGEAIEVHDLIAAVRQARAVAPQGAVVLLSPAAPSYNTYRNFEERGDHFAALAAEHP